MSSVNGSATNCGTAMTDTTLPTNGDNSYHGVVVNPQGTLLYTQNYGDNTVYSCQVDPNTGGVSACINASTGNCGGFGNMEGITMNTAGTMLYMTSGNNFYTATIQSNGTNSNCTTVTNADNSRHTFKIALR